MLLILTNLFLLSGCGDSGPATASDTTGTGGEDTDIVQTDTPTVTQSGDCDDTLQGEANPAEGQPGHTVVARWKYDRASAFTLSFDDSTPGQANHGVPAMIAHGLTGTWFVNPGQAEYQAYVDVWETLAPQGGQELANHSMHHDGADTYAEAESEIGDAADIIWSAYPPERSPLHAFNNGGGTDWAISEQEYADLLQANHCIEREHSTGIPSLSQGEMLLDDLGARLMVEAEQGGWSDRWGKIHFHGICDPVINNNGHCICTVNQPCEEYGEGVLSAAVELNQFNIFLDGLTSDPWLVDNVWIDGFIAVHKYQTLRNGASFQVVPDGAGDLVIRMASDLDPVLYDGEVTLLTTVSDTWSTCTATQCGKPLSCEIVGGNAVYEATLGHGDVVIDGS